MQRKLFSIRGGGRWCRLQPKVFPLGSIIVPVITTDRSQCFVAASQRFASATTKNDLQLGHGRQAQLELPMTSRIARARTNGGIGDLG